MESKKRVVMDCRQNPRGRCTLTIAGSEEEVLDVGEYHMTMKHGFKKEPELRKQLRGFLKEESYAR